MGKNKQKPNKKQPTARFMPEKNKRPRSAEIKSRPFKWRTKYSDLEHASWGWCCIEIERLFKEVIVKLHDFETMEVQSMIGKDMLHTCNPAVINKEAQKRLNELQKSSFLPEDLAQSDLASIRMGGKPRIWGYLIGDTFQLLWWDPLHKIYPTKKRHT